LSRRRGEFGPGPSRGWHPWRPCWGWTSGFVVEVAWGTIFYRRLRCRSLSEEEDCHGTCVSWRCFTRVEVFRMGKSVKSARAVSGWPWSSGWRCFPGDAARDGGGERCSIAAGLRPVVSRELELQEVLGADSTMRLWAARGAASGARTTCRWTGPYRKVCERALNWC
jgi:hypothetical protein